MTTGNAIPDRDRATTQANPPGSTARCANGWTGGQYSVFRFALGAYLLVHLACLFPVASEMSSNAGALGKVSESALHPFFPNLLLFWDSPIGIVALLLAATGLSVPFALGVRDRFVALILLYLGLCLSTTSPPISNSSMPFIGWILLAHAFVPRRPYGSWDARGRLDPGADWRMPARIYTATWIVLAIGYVYSGATKLGNPSWVDGSHRLASTRTRLRSAPTLRVVGW